MLEQHFKDISQTYLGGERLWLAAMLRKPFRSPLLKQVSSPSASNERSEPDPKRRRISSDNERSTEPSGPRLVFKAPGVSTLPRKPLLPVQNPAVVGDADVQAENGIQSYYNVLWYAVPTELFGPLLNLHRRKFSTKKHKNWDGDGILSLRGGYAYLQDVSGKEMGRAPCDTPLLPGSTLSVGGKEVEVESILPKADYLAGRQFLKAASKPPPTEELPLPSKAKPPPTKPPPKPKSDTKTALQAEKEDATKVQNVSAPKTLGTQLAWKNPLLYSTVMPPKETKEPTPRHDPHAANAIVMQRPKAPPKGRQIVDVVVDPILSQHLREHQRKGVTFLYECVMGLRDFDGQGAILADEMGLGKTLQTIALLWTLLKQNPIYEAPPVIKKALIVCPVTLINNWRKEIRKWLGSERIGVFVADEKKKRITDFTMGKSYSIMIIGYEKLRTVQEELKKGPGIDIVIVDEGHRLKTAKNKSGQAIRALNTARRVILSGTPIQNDLGEFYFMADFVNPDLLGSFKTFTKEFETPIVKSRQPEATEQEIEKGTARSEELATLTNKFILRRTADVLSKYLPPKTEYVLLCRPVATQATAYHHVLAHPAFQAALGNSEASLQLITVLKKVCNSPLLLKGRDPTASVSPLMASLLSSIPTELLRSNAGSTKIRALDQLLHTIRTKTSDKVVLVSNYTLTLDLLCTLLTSLGYPFARLDGSTPSGKRQDIVDTFNRAPQSLCFAFLLSAKAGGVGINLIGASRLVLFDVDWNPATDLQTMARIHRDGQKKPCFIYRFLMAGGIDEKIWQRQITKLGLASNIMDQKGGGNSFTREELRDLFRLDEGLSCQTHDLLGCNCGGRGISDAVAADSGDWTVLDSDPEPDPDQAEEESDPDFDIPVNPSARRALIRANKVDMEAQEQKIKDDGQKARHKGNDTKMQSLMAYTHIDTSGFKDGTDEDMEALVQDEILSNVLKDEDNRISFVFAKTSG